MKKEDNTEKQPKGCLYIVSTPIGNDDDITQRALKAIKLCDVIYCEEMKVGARLLHKYNITNQLEKLDEHNESERTPEILDLLKSGKKVALISDCGTPVFEDPGFFLLKECLRNKIEVVVIPGVSSIMTALVRSGFSLKQFLYAGLLSRTSDERHSQLEWLSRERRTVVILDTPYRLLQILEAASDVMPDRNVYLGCNLTMPFETHHYGSFQELFEKFKDLGFKGEFVIVFEGAYSTEKREFIRKTDDRQSLKLRPKKAFIKVKRTPDEISNLRNSRDEQPDTERRSNRTSEERPRLSVKKDFHSDSGRGYGRSSDSKPRTRSSRDSKPESARRYGRSSDSKPEFRSSRDDKSESDRSFGRSSDSKPSFRGKRDEKPDSGRNYGRSSDSKPGFRGKRDEKPDSGRSYGRNSDSKPGFRGKKEEKSDSGRSYKRTSGTKPKLRTKKDGQSDTGRNYNRRRKD
ncbi:MAG: putative methyltransferase [Ignavibacteria bacterium]|nr:putative methyltransferase [Ignavibacteria bacterium]